MFVYCVCYNIIIRVQNHVILVKLCLVKLHIAHLDTFVGNTSCGGVNDYDYAVPIPLMDAIRVARQLTDFTTTSETL